MANDEFKYGTKESFVLMQLAELKDEIKNINTNLRGDLREIKSDLRDALAEVKADVKELKEITSADNLAATLQINELKTKSKMWGAAVAAVISVGISIASIYFK